MSDDDTELRRRGRAPRALAAAAAALLLVAAGCGGGNGVPGLTGSGGSGPPVSPEGAAFENQFAHAWCDNLASCCQDDTPPFSAASCLTSAHRLAESFAANAAGLSGLAPQFNSSQVARCLAAVTASALSCPSSAPIMFPLAQNAVGEPCANVFSAPAGPGASCEGFFASECEPPASSPGYAGCSQEGGGGMCVQTTLVGMGQPCEMGSGSVTSKCDSALDVYCDHTMHLCVPPAAQDQSCADLPCDVAANLVCATVGASRLCKPRPAAGESCVGYPDGACAGGTYCNNVCLPLGTDGAFCNASLVATECAPTHYCASGVCAPRLADGSACTGDDQCLRASYCAVATGLCTARVARGQPCSVAEHDPCVPGTICQGRNPNAPLTAQTDAICATWFYPYFCAPPGG